MSRGDVQNQARLQLGLKKRILFTSVLVLVLVLFAEAAGQIVLRVAYGRRASEVERLVDYDARLGWANIKNKVSPDRYGPGEHATHNSIGMRGTREYSVAPADSRYRIAFLGDSFTYGVDTGDETTFVALLETLEPSIEALNMGSPGYGIDQMYLSYRDERAAFKTDLLVLAFIEDDFRRMKLRSFMTQNPKPRLFLDGKRIEVTNVPVPTWGVPADRGWLAELPSSMALVQIPRSAYDMLWLDYDPWPIAERLFSDLNQRSQANGQRFALLYLPAITDFADGHDGSTARRVHEFAVREGIPFLDITDEFRSATELSSAPLFGVDQKHYSEAGYELAAELLLSQLRDALPEVPR